MTTLIALLITLHPIPTINLSEIHNVDMLPVCVQEDCSDQAGQVGMWQSNEGSWYLELGEGVTYLVIDDTVTR